MTIKISTTISEKDISGILDDFDKGYKSEFEQVVLQLITELKQATPVDTGKARDGWMMTLTKADLAYITNEVEYIGILNQGHSKQAPAYFVEQVVHRLGFTVVS